LDADKKQVIGEVHNYKVVKSNELIQRSRFNLSLQEQKIILYLISKIRPEDMDLKEHVFEIADFCKVCGVGEDNGANYKYIKQTLKELRDKSVWVEVEDGIEMTLAWIERVAITRRSGSVKIKIDDMMKPYLIQLKEKFTQYELLYTLAMKSQYSIRLYELLKSYEYRHSYTFEIEDLKRKVSAENYNRFPDFKRYVLDIALREVNELSDINVSFTIEKEGKRYAKINFFIKLKRDIGQRLETWKQIESSLKNASKGGDV
jgi:plasmid replication initiation protein